jgi:hypothetical protein
MKQQLIVHLSRNHVVRIEVASRPAINWISIEPCHAPLGDKFPLLQDREVIAERRGKCKVVTNHHHGGEPMLICGAQDVFRQTPLLNSIKGTRRLIKEDYTLARGDGPGDSHALLSAKAKFHWQPPTFILQPKSFKPSLRLRERFRFSLVALELDSVRHVLADIEMRKQREVLKDSHHGTSGSGQACNVGSAYENSAGIWRKMPPNYLKKSGLSASVRTYDCKTRPAADGEANVI